MLSGLEPPPGSSVPIWCMDRERTFWENGNGRNSSGTRAPRAWRLELTWQAPPDVAGARHCVEAGADVWQAPPDVAGAARRTKSHTQNCY